jgi:CheY-like chemotaxis protein
VLSVLAHEVRQKASVERHLEEVPIISGNPGQLGELFVNLVTNALDSIPPDHPQAHCLTIRTGTSPRGEIVVEVEDTGSGIADDVRDRIFDPFFSTKPPGLGTGLGLSVCHGIARSHGGSIDVETRPERGSCFRVRLPGAPPQAAVTQGASARKPRLLIVDDDERVADALGRLLGRDYEVTVVRGGQEAIDLIERGKQPKPDIILCDFFLGQITGQDLYERFRLTRPELRDRMVFMTGAAFTEVSRRFLDGITNPCLDKPFSHVDFKKAVELLPYRVKGASRTRLRTPSTDEEHALQRSSRTRDRR